MGLKGSRPTCSARLDTKLPIKDEIKIFLVCKKVN